MMLLMSHYQILDKHAIIDMFCSKWTFLSHLTFHALPSMCYFSLWNPFSQNRWTTVYIYRIKDKAYDVRCEQNISTIVCLSRIWKSLMKLELIEENRSIHIAVISTAGIKNKIKRFLQHNDMNHSSGKL